MTHPEIPGNGLGIPVMPYGFDGDNWIAFLVTELGRLEVSLASLPTGAATIADGADVVLGSLADAVVVAGAVGSVSAKLRRLTTDLDALLTELKLKADLTETQPVESKDGDKIFSFESIVEQKVFSENLTTGDNTLSGTPVEGGKVWKITHVNFIYIGTVPTEMILYAWGLAENITLKNQVAPVSGRYYNWTGEIYLQGGDYIRLDVEDATSGDDMHVRYVGVQMNAP